MAFKNYRRSVSFPIPASKSAKLITHSKPQSIADGLARLQDLINHPCSPVVVDELLDRSLRLADAYGSFRSAVVSLKQEQSATQAAIRRNDAARIASCLRLQKKAEKEISRIAASVRNIAEKWAAEDVDDAMAATASMSADSFEGIVKLSASATSTSSLSRGHHHVVRRLASFSKKEEVAEVDEEHWRNGCLVRLEALEERLAKAEAESEKVLRSMLNTRVHLLNILSPSL